jgi:hypothetical protein
MTLLRSIQFVERQGHTGITTLIRNKEHKGADRTMKDTKLAG